MGLLFAAIAAMAFAQSAKADTLTFTGSSGDLAASVTFTVTGNTLTVELSNTATADASVPADVLTAVFFNTNGVSLTPTSATITSGSLQLHDGTTVHTGTLTNIAGEWAYVEGSDQGVGAAGFSVFGSGDIIDDSAPLFNTQTPAGTAGAPPDGLAGGLITGFDSPNGGLQNRWLLNGTATFTFTFDGTLSAADITDVVFQYGTSLDEPSFPGDPGDPPVPPTDIVPAPPALLLAGIGLGCCMIGSLRRRLTGAKKTAV